MNSPIQPGDRVVTPTGHHMIAVEHVGDTVDGDVPVYLCVPLYGSRPDAVSLPVTALVRVDPATVASPAVYAAWRALEDALHIERERWQHDRGAWEAVDDCLGHLDSIRDCISDISPTVEEP